MHTGYDPASSAAQSLRTRLGNGSAAARFTRGLLRPKAEVSPADDPRKHEADRVADPRLLPMGGCSASSTVTDATALSKLLACALRHRPDALGIVLDAQGWTYLDHVVTAIRTCPLFNPLVRCCGRVVVTGNA